MRWKEIEGGWRLCMWCHDERNGYSFSTGLTEAFWWESVVIDSFICRPSRNWRFWSSNGLGMWSMHVRGSDFAKATPRPRLKIWRILEIKYSDIENRENLHRKIWQYSDFAAGIYLVSYGDHSQDPFLSVFSGSLRILSRLGENH